MKRRKCRVWAPPSYAAALLAHVGHSGDMERKSGPNRWRRYHAELFASIAAVVVGGGSICCKAVKFNGVEGTIPATIGVRRSGPSEFFRT